MELTKDYFDQQLGSLAKRDDLEQIKDDLRTLKMDMVEVKQVLNEIDQRDKEDSNAFAKSLVSHDERITSVEQDIKQLKLNQKTL